MNTKEITKNYCSKGQVLEQAKSQKSLLLQLDGYIIDATTFAPHHPGGRKAIERSVGCDISSEMKLHHPLARQLAISMTVGSYGKQITRTLNPLQSLHKQVWKMNHQSYNALMSKPHWMFVPSPRLFQSDLLQTLSHSRWYSVAILPAILICYMGFHIQLWNTLSLLQIIFHILGGLLLFSLTEYSLHRFIFHAEWYLPDIKILRTIHFYLHGIHHLLPNDPLVLPPQYAVIIFMLAKLTFLNHVLFQDPLTNFVFWSSYLIGYVIYDSTHYFLHFLDIKKGSFPLFQKLQRYHTQHHYGGEHAGFGVSSPLWDIVLRTGFKNNQLSHIKN